MLLYAYFFFTLLENKKLVDDFGILECLIFIKEKWTISCLCKYFQVHVMFFLVYYQQCFELPCMNIIIVCSTFSQHMCDFEVSITHVWPKY